MQALIDVILPVFLVLGAGYVAVWRGWFSDAWIDGLMRFAQTFAVPLLLFRAISQMDLAQEFSLPMLAGFYLGAATGFAAGLLGARYIFGRPWTDSVAIGFVGLFSNGVLLGLPITERAWGPEALASNYSIIAFHSPFCYGIGITAMELARNAGGGLRAAAPRILRAMFRNTFVLAILSALALNLSGLTLPRAVGDAADMMAGAALPVALFGLGGTLFHYRPAGDIRIILYVVAISLVLHPVITWAVAAGNGVDGQSLRSAVLTAAMPPGVNAFLFANMYGVGKRVAASAVLIATALTVLTAWFWITVLP